MSLVTQLSHFVTCVLYHTLKITSDELKGEV
jgi:hypothetical protein